MAKAENIEDGECGTHFLPHVCIRASTTHPSLHTLTVTAADVVWSPPVFRVTLPTVHWTASRKKHRRLRPKQTIEMAEAHFAHSKSYVTVMVCLTSAFYFIINKRSLIHPQNISGVSLRLIQRVSKRFWKEIGKQHEIFLMCS